MIDWLIFRPDDVDLSRSPLRATLDVPTRVLGAFNPGLTRLPNGNLLLMVRVAETLAAADSRSISWTPNGFVVLSFPPDDVEHDDPRFFHVHQPPHRLPALTSLSWLLPVELDPEGRRVVEIHYEHAIAPAASYEAYGVEDPRISRIGDRWYMTTCSVSPERLCTTLHISDDGLRWLPMGLLLDHQNKDMLIFEGKVGDFFLALTRPLGDVYFTYPEDSPWAGGPSINLARSPDALHWKPLDKPFIRARKDSTSAAKVGGGTPPILTDAGWLILYHGVEPALRVGAYRTFWALLDRADPSRILQLEDVVSLLESRPDLTASIAHQHYISCPVVFTTGIVDGGDNYLVASGEADLACRMTLIPKTRFA